MLSVVQGIQSVSQFDYYRLNSALVLFLTRFFVLPFASCPFSASFFTFSRYICYFSENDKQNARKQQQMLDAKRPRYTRRNSGSDHQRPSTSSQGRSSSESRSSGSGSFQFNPSALAAPLGERRRSSRGSGGDSFGKYASYEQRGGRGYPDHRQNQNAPLERRTSRDNPIHRPSGVVFNPMPSTPINQRRLSNEQYNNLMTTMPSTLQPHFGNDMMDTLQPKPLATVTARRRFSIELPETLVSSGMMSTAFDTPQDHRHPRNRYPSQRH